MESRKNRWCDYKDNVQMVEAFKEDFPNLYTKWFEDCQEGDENVFDMMQFAFEYGRQTAHIERAELAEQVKELEKKLDEKNQAMEEMGAKVNKKLDEFDAQSENLKQACDRIADLSIDNADLQELLETSNSANETLRRENDELKKNLDIERAKVQCAEVEHNSMCDHPAALASLLAGLGFKGTLTREQSIYNSKVSDDPVGAYTETLTI